MLRKNLLGVRKLMICVLTVALITLGTWFGGNVQVVQAETVISGDYKYELNNVYPRNITILDYTGIDKVVSIPAEINGSPVVSIGVNAFNNKQLTSVTIPNGVKNIYSNAFSNNQLTSVTIPNSVTSIGDYAFYNNTLTSVEIPNSVTSIGDYAFKLNQLTSVAIPNSITNIEDYVFSTNQLTSVTIPEGVKSIGTGAFEGNISLTTLTILEGLTSIGAGAFVFNSLTSVTFPNSLRSIDEFAFYGNPFTSLIFPEGVTSIGDYAFAQNFKNTIKEIIVKGNSTAVGDNAFVWRSIELIIAHDPSPAKSYAEKANHKFIDILSVWPSEPRNVTATAGNGTVTISFDAQDSDSGYPITEYKVTSSPGGFTGTSATASPVVFTGLTNGTAYTFTVVATNLVGNSVASAPSASVTPVEPPPIVISPPVTSPPIVTSPSPSIDPIRSTNGNITLPLGSRGEVSLNDKIFITIPANATSKPLEITIKEMQDALSLFNHKEVPASSVFDVQKNVPEDHNKPATLTMVFDLKQVNSNHTVAIFYYNEATETWVKIENGKIEGNRISVEVNNFMEFTVLVVDSETGLPIEAPPVFSDIIGHWAESDINKAAQSGIVNGYVNGMFKPNGLVTRAEFVVMLMKAMKPQEEAAKLTFTDSAKIGTWAQKAVEQAVQAGIVKGYTDGSFRPIAPITRAEMAVMIANALALKFEPNNVTDFVDDAEIPNWAKGHVAALKNLDLISGKGMNTFAPIAKATRAEAVTILLKVYAQESK